MSYICDCCNRTFEEPTTHNEYRETLSPGFYVYEEILGCPFCGGGFEEVPATRCAECGEKVEDDFPICEDCIERIDYQIGEILNELSEESRKAYCENAEQFSQYLMRCYHTYRRKEDEK